MGSGRKRLQVAAAALALGVSLTACSSEGGKESEESAATGGGGNVADTPRIRVAMITHSAPGDTFWDIVQKGAKAAAQKDNAKFLYSNDPDGTRQAQLVETAINQDVDGIVVTLSKPGAMKSAVEKAIDKGIPVVTINAGEQESKEYGALAHFGQEESVAGQAAGEQLNKTGAKKSLCVIHEQGHVGLDARCAGAKETFDGEMVNVHVNGENMPDVRSTIQSRLQADQSIDSVLALGAPFALTAVKAADDANSDAQVSTFDLNKDLVAGLKSGDIDFAVDQQPYLQGYLAVDQIWLHINNGNVIGGGQTVLTGPQVVTADTVDEISKFTDRGTR
ncbi:MAG: substrate-binding domain-containing protein [Streptosporangiales bacterium]|nr:substrate-binding domain-containing protein [Streptosporangiales bacterium]